MDFKAWFETNVAAWGYEIDRASVNRDFAFANWFPPSGVVHLPFTGEAGENVDQDLVDYFQDNKNYKIQDYQQGIVQDKYGRPVRIGKALDRGEQEELKRIEIAYKQGQLSDLKYKNELTGIKKYFQELKSTFDSSPLRRGINSKSPYMIVISNKPDDIAGMSTNRDWTSCMDLKDGVNHRSVYCELKNGGFIAYLCYAHDTDINKPLARIHIRRFDNKKGQSVAIPEESVYGNEISGFSRQVQAWIDSKQGKIRPGRYVRKGGWYSDTFGSTNPKKSPKQQQRDMSHTILPKTAKGLMRLLDKELAKSSSNYADRILGALVDPNLPIDDKDKKKLNDIIRTKFSRHLHSFLTKFPDMMTLEDFKKMDYYQRNRLAKANRNDPKYKELNKEIANQAIMALDLNDPKLKINQKGESELAAGAEVDDILRMMDAYHGSQMPEPILRKVVGLGEQILDKYKSQLTTLLADKHDPNSPRRNLPKDPSPRTAFPTAVLLSIVHHLHMSGADTPNVIRFYHKLLHYWDILDGDVWLYGTIGNLGKNGESFLPFLRKKLDERKNSAENKWERERYDNVTEKIRYAIDSIENGTGRSDKYHYTH